METDLLEQMGMRREETSAKELQNFFFCKDVNVSGIYHTKGTYDGRMSMPMMVVMIVLGFITVFVNLGVIIRTIKILRRGHDNKPAFYFIGNLALSDLAIGLYIIIAFPLHMANKSDLWQQKTCSLQIGVAVTACQETIFTIVLISIDKYLYICHALKYHQIVTMTRVYVAVICSWVLSLIIGSLPAMGMMVKWEETCGRCIFAQVVSKDFAILFFITAVVLPYAVAVSLYSILLFLALKMQKARYGGSYKVSESTRTSLFRLSIMSKKSSKSRTSVTSTTKSTVSKSSLSNTSSNASGASLSKTQRRIQRRLAMQEYKASLPGLDEKGDNVSAKLVHVRSTNSNENLKLQQNNIVNDSGSEVVTHLMKEDTLQANTHNSENKPFHPERDSQISPLVVETNSIKERHSSNDSNNCKDTSDIVIAINEKEDDKTNLSKVVAVADVNGQNGIGSKKNNSVSEEITNVSDASDGEDITEQPPQPRDASAIEGRNSTCVSNKLRKQISESSRSTKSLPSLTSTDDGDESEPGWSMAGYFKRVVSDTKDKVLFLKKCRAVKTVFLIIGSFTVTYVPFVVGSLVYNLEKEKSKPLLHALQSILFCAIIANSLVNPLLYAYGYREFRIRAKKFKGVFATEKKPKL